jgi:hypothetical protein
MPYMMAVLLLIRVVHAAMSQGKAQAKGTLRPALLMWMVLVPITISLTLVVIAGGWAFSPLLVAALVLMFPWSIARRLLVPLGLSKAAAYVARLPSISFGEDAAGASALAGAWALLRKRSRTDEELTWVTDRIAKLSPTRGAGLAASGLLAAARGDLESARIAMGGVRALDRSVCPAPARRAASGFLASDAAARGAWAEIAELSTTLLDDGRQAWLLAGVARALLLEPEAPRGWALWMRWMIAPGRRSTQPLVERALAALDGHFISTETPFAAPLEVRENDGLGRAMALHASLLADDGGVSAEELRAIAHAWDDALESGTLIAEVSARAALLGAPSAGSALGALRETIDEDLARVALAGNVPLADLVPAGPTATRVRASLRDRLLREIELASDAIRRRADERLALPGADEWREWSALAAAYERGARLAGNELRRLAFYKVHGDATHFAVWLFNDRKERAIANAVFRFLLREAQVLGDDANAALQQKNVDCGA